MSKYYKTTYNPDTYSAEPPIGPLLGGELAKRSRVESVMRAQDRVPALGRRIVMSQSLSGYQAFLVPNTNPQQFIAGTRTHPPPSLERAVARTRFDLTPGCMLQLSALVMPSGATQTYRVVDQHFEMNNDAVQGRLRLVLNWYDRNGVGSLQTETTIELPASQQLYGAVPTNGDFWRQVRLVRSSVMTPENLLPPNTLQEWSLHTHVLAELYHIGGVRVVDAVLSEVPYGLSLEAEDDDSYWVGHQIATAAGGPSYDSAAWPYDRYDDSGVDGDPRRGTQHLLDVHHAQWDRLGPALIYWTSYQEVATSGSLVHTVGANTDNTTYSEAYAFTSSTSFVRFPDMASTTYTTTQPGWSIAAASYARRLAENEQLPYNGSVPVIVRVRAGSSVAATEATFRIQASAYSYIDVDLSNLQTTPGWYTAYGHLRCGAGPGDPSVVQAFVRRDSGTGSVRIYNFGVYSAGSWAPAEL